MYIFAFKNLLSKVEALLKDAADWDEDSWIVENVCCCPPALENVMLLPFSWKRQNRN